MNKGSYKTSRYLWTMVSVTLLGMNWPKLQGYDMAEVQIHLEPWCTFKTNTDCFTVYYFTILNQKKFFYENAAKLDRQKKPETINKLYLFLNVLKTDDIMLIVTRCTSTSRNTHITPHTGTHNTILKVTVLSSGGEQRPKTSTSSTPHSSSKD